MSSKSILTPLVLIFIFKLTTSYCQSDTDLDKTLEAVSPEAIKASMTFLADDLLEGRQPGTRGFAIASKYIETQFMAMGLQPGIDQKSYIQKVSLRKGVVDENNCRFILVVNGKKETWSQFRPSSSPSS